jgi:hypothetical protein
MTHLFAYGTLMCEDIMRRSPTVFRSIEGVLGRYAGGARG